MEMENSGFMINPQINNGDPQYKLPGKSIELRGADLLIRTLQDQGVKYIFSVSGEAILSIYDACLDSGIKIIHARTENAAVAMADSYARTTGQPSVCLVTLGAGVANCVGGMATAFLDGSPVILIGGVNSVENWGKGDFAEIEAAMYMRPITKWTETVLDSNRLPEYLLRAYRHALAGRPGPVFLQIPINVSSGTVECMSEIPHYIQPRYPSQSNPAVVTKAVKLISNVKQPVLFCGSGAWWSQATQALNQFVKAFELPTFGWHLGRGLLTDARDFYFGSGIHACSPESKYASAHCDLIIAIGLRLDFELDFLCSNSFNPEAKIIQIDSEPTVIGHYRNVDIGLAGDINLILQQFLSHTPDLSQRSPQWKETIRLAGVERKQEWGKLSALDSTPIHPARLCFEISQFLEQDATITLGGGNIFSWARTLLEPFSPGQLLAPYRTWSLGFAIPLALGAKIAHPSRQVLALSGDGSVGYDIIEMDTAARYNIPIVCVVANDAAWSMMIDTQTRLYGQARVHATYLQPRAYDQIVNALGGYGETVKEPGQIRPALKRAFESGVPACLNVLTAIAGNPEVPSQQ